MTTRSPFVKVPLTRGKVALVSPEDAERVMAFKWQVNGPLRNGLRVWYAMASIRDGRRWVHVCMHRLILGFGPDDPQVDHKNGNKLDNRRSNLRPATQAQNQQNRRKTGNNLYRGVRDRGRWGWEATIQVDNKRRYLGSFATAEEAARVYDEAARRLHGEFCCVNFPRDGERRAW